MLPQLENSNLQPTLTCRCQIHERTQINSDLADLERSISKMTQDATSSIPPELILQIFESISLSDLLSVHRVNRRWRILAPHAGSRLLSRLFQLVLEDVESPEESPYLVSLGDREAYVSYIESKHNIRIPDQYRTVLLQWPISRPPPGTHWPYGLRFFANGFCSCGPEILNEFACVCEQTEVVTNNVCLQESVLNIIYRGEQFDYRSEVGDSRWELFFNPPRLYTDAQNAQTIRFMLAHPASSWTSSVGAYPWSQLDVRVLRLSPYAAMVTVTVDGVTSDVRSFGDFWMVIEGPCAGQVHAWSEGWYHGFESDNFLDWRYEEWDPEFFEKQVSDEADDDSISPPEDVG